mgnify:CR=1 FL=1|jgi:hypothetical protein
MPRSLVNMSRVRNNRIKRKRRISSTTSYSDVVRLESGSTSSIPEDALIPKTEHSLNGKRCKCSECKKGYKKARVRLFLSWRAKLI